MLSECTPLQPGDWVVQNAANSGVGRSLIALAKLRGLKTINLARDDATFAELTAAGADVVHVDDPDAVGDVRAVIGDARVALAVDCRRWSRGGAAARIAFRRWMVGQLFLGHGRTNVGRHPDTGRQAPHGPRILCRRLRLPRQGGACHS